MKIRQLFTSLLLCALTLGTMSCGKDSDNPVPDTPSGSQDTPGNSGNQDNPDTPNTPDSQLLSDLTCKVSEFASQYKKLKVGSPVNVTITDVSDANLPELSKTLKSISGPSLSKAASDEYIFVIVLLSPDSDLTEIPAEAFAGCDVITSITLPESVEVVAAAAFADCVNLDVVKILTDLVSFAEDAFDVDINIDTLASTATVTETISKISFNTQFDKIQLSPVEFRTKLVLPGSETMARLRHKFLGWALSENSTRPDFAPNAIASNLDVDCLYAVWQPLPFMIRFHNNFDYKAEYFCCEYKGDYIYFFTPYNIPEGLYFDYWADEYGNRFVFDEYDGRDIDLYPVYTSTPPKPTSSLEEYNYNKVN